LYRFFLPVILAAVSVARAQQSDLGQLDASPTLFTVMAALNAAGFDAGLNSPDGHPLRAAIRAELGKRSLGSVASIKDFVANHRRRTDAEELSQYISFALTAGPPPKFAIRLRDVDIPPDAAVLREFSPLLEAFYKEADIDGLWRRSQAAINQYIERYHTPVLNSVQTVNTYLRQQSSGFQGRRFQVLIELLAPPNIVQSRSYGNEYTIVVTPSNEPRIFDIRHAYLHYSLDPLATRYQEILDRKKVLAEHAMRSRALDEVFKEDFLQLVTECLIKAVESRLDHKPEVVQQALLDGYILTPYFAEHLPAYEKEEQAMLLYYPEMIKGIDNVAEDARLSKVTFNTSPGNRPGVKSATPPPEPEAPLTGAAKTLDEAERLYTSRNLDRSKALYLQVLQETDRKPMHAAAYYGLARIAILQKNPGPAEQLFLKSLSSDPEPAVRAWVLVYLGRLSQALARDHTAAGRDDEAGKDAETAVKYFQDALKVEGASDMARNAANQGMQAFSKK
jgi:tetratricopeptide (TPR) repeat protein